MKKQKGKKATGTKTEERQSTEPGTSSSGATTSKDVVHEAKEPEEPKTQDIQKAVDLEPDSVNEERTSQGQNDEAVDEPASPPSHGRQPSLSIQSKMRSSSFRQGSVSQAPLSPTLTNAKSPNLPPLSPQGDTMTDIYRKQAARLEHVEKENRRLEREVGEKEAWRSKMEEELEELREAKGELAALRDQLAKAEAKEEELGRLVRISIYHEWHGETKLSFWLSEERSSFPATAECPSSVANLEIFPTHIFSWSISTHHFYLIRPGGSTKVQVGND